MNWYCVHTKPKKESRVSAYLGETLGCETYLPRLRQQRMIRRVKRVVTSPLFPRYLFCRFDFGQGHRAIRFAPDVLDIMSFGAIPAIVDDGIIREMKAWAGDAVDVITITPTFHAGDRVRITDGPMRGLEAVIQTELNGRDRVSVILFILERNVSLNINRWQLSKAI